MTSPIINTDKPIVDEKLGITAEDAVHTIIDMNTVIDGTVTVKAGRGLLVYGEINGDVRCEGTLVVAQSARINVRSKLDTRRMIAMGQIDAISESAATEVLVHELLLAKKTASIKAGSLGAGELETERGARILSSVYPLERSASARPSEPVAKPSASAPAAPAPTQADRSAPPASLTTAAVTSKVVEMHGKPPAATTAPKVEALRDGELGALSTQPVIGALPVLDKLADVVAPSTSQVANG